MARTYKYHFIYHIRILIGKHKNCFYVGLHSTNNIDDGYCGSGSKVSRIINGLRKKGHKDSEIYERTIITFATSRKEVIELESIYVTSEIMNNKFCLNCKTGGNQCVEYSNESISKMIENLKKFYDEHQEYCQNASIRLKKRFEDPKQRENVSIKQKKRFEDPKQREDNKKRVKIAMNKSDVKNRISIAAKKRFEDPKERENASIRKKKHFEDPKNREKTSIATKKAMNKPDVKEKCKNAQLQRFNGENGDVEREKVSVLTKQAMKDPNIRKKCGNGSRGKCYVNNGIECKKIHESKVEEFLSNNPDWVRGGIKGRTHRVYHEDGTFHMEKNVA